MQPEPEATHPSMPAGVPASGALRSKGQKPGEPGRAREARQGSKTGRVGPVRRRKRATRPRGNSRRLYGARLRREMEARALVRSSSSFEAPLSAQPRLPWRLELALLWIRAARELTGAMLRTATTLIAEEMARQADSREAEAPAGTGKCRGRRSKTTKRARREPRRRRKTAKRARRQPRRRRKTAKRARRQPRRLFGARLRRAKAEAKGGARESAPRRAAPAVPLIPWRLKLARPGLHEALRGSRTIVRAPTPPVTKPSERRATPLCWTLGDQRACAAAPRPKFRDGRHHALSRGPRGAGSLVEGARAPPASGLSSLR